MNQEFLNELLAHGASWAYGTGGRPFDRIPGVVTVSLNPEESERFGALLYKAEMLRLSQLVCSCGAGRIVAHKSGAMRYSCACTNDEVADPSLWLPIKPE